MIEKSDKQKARIITQELNTLAQFKAFKLIDELLIKAATKISTSSALKMIIYARVTYPYKSELPHWTDYVANVKKELDNRNIDSNKELSGLI